MFGNNRSEIGLSHIEGEIRLGIERVSFLVKNGKRLYNYIE